MSGFSRRGFLKAIAAAGGAAAGTRLAGGSFLGNALAATEPTSVVIIHFIGGFNSLWSSAAPLVGNFGVTGGNYTALGNGVSVDNVLADAYSPFVRDHIATIGVKHGESSHGGARRSLWSNAAKCYGHELANAIGGDAANKALVAGNLDLADTERPKAPVNGIAFQKVLNLKSYLDTIGGAGPGPREPDRDITLAGITGAQTMSRNALTASPSSLLGVSQGYSDAVATLKKPAESFNLGELQTAYGLGTGTNIGSFASKLAAAELFLRTGTNVVSLFDGGWDTHNDPNGNKVRNLMGPLAPALKTFLDRNVTAASTRNVVVAMIGDFARSLPGSNHQPNLSATVIGKYVKRGTTGLVDADVQVKADTPSSAGFWSYLAAASKVTSPFGANPHGLVV